MLINNSNVEKEVSEGTLETPPAPLKRGRKPGELAAKMDAFMDANPKASPAQIAEAIGSSVVYVTHRKYKMKQKKKKAKPAAAAKPAGSIVFVSAPVSASEQEVRQHPLYPVFVKAIEQVMYGKGERHGGVKTPFLDQPWTHYARMHGRGFLTGQAAKKLEEAVSTRTGEAFDQEVLGAIVYAGMAILHNRSV